MDNQEIAAMTRFYTWVLAILSGLDLLTTLAFLKAGHLEGNRLFAPLFNNGHLWEGSVLKILITVPWIIIIFNTVRDNEEHNNRKMLWITYAAVCLADGIYLVGVMLNIWIGGA